MEEDIVDNFVKKASTAFLTRKQECAVVRALRWRYGPSALGYAAVRLEGRGKQINYRCRHRSTDNTIIVCFEHGRIVVLAEYGDRT